MPECISRSSRYAVKQTIPKYTTRRTADLEHNDVAVPQTPIHATKRLLLSLDRIRRLSPRSSKSPARKTRKRHQHSAQGVVNDGGNSSLPRDVRSAYRTQTYHSKLHGIISAKVSIAELTHRCPYHDESSDSRTQTSWHHPKTSHRTDERQSYPHSASCTPRQTNFGPHDQCRYHQPVYR